MFLEKVKKLRSDLSEWVVHFTQGKPAEARERLEKILDEGIKGFGKPISFTEAPIREFAKLFQIFEKYPQPRFAPYGVAVKKEWLFQLGGRPAVYLPADEKSLLREHAQWLHVAYDPLSRDFTWQREWRTNADVVQLDRVQTLVIVPNEEAGWGLTFDWDVDVEYEGPGEYSYSGSRTDFWHYLTLESIDAGDSAHSDEAIAKRLKAGA